MNELYALAFKLCIQALIPNPATINNLPEHQQMYIIKAATEVCKKETEAERMMMCVEKNFLPEEC
jgi:hypothetical protein